MPSSGDRLSDLINVPSSQTANPSQSTPERIPCRTIRLPLPYVAQELRQLRRAVEHESLVAVQLDPVQKTRVREVVRGIGIVVQPALLGGDDDLLPSWICTGAAC
jgi:hypothetical protein